jgi:hypothetical protein
MMRPGAMPCQTLSDRKSSRPARLGVVVTRGLLLDLLATGKREAVDAAMERYIAALETAGTRPPATEAARERPPVAQRSTGGGSP